MVFQMHFRGAAPDASFHTKTQPVPAWRNGRAAIGDMLLAAGADRVAHDIGVIFVRHDDPFAFDNAGRRIFQPDADAVVG